jgi:ribosomal protein S18 acetylase RimI-like enzyme
VRFHLRPASDDDREFLYTLHCRTMRDVIEKTWGWDEAWQRTDFDCRFRECLASIIECDGRPAGGLLVEWKPDSLYIHEIQLLPEYQSQGVGTEVIENVIEQAAARRLPVTLSVVAANPRAQRLYERLGFEVTDVEPPFIRMRYRGDSIGLE